MNAYDKDTIKIMCDMSNSIYNVKWKWRKILSNGLDVVDSIKPPIEVVGKYGKRLLYVYKKRYFNLPELMQYLVDRIKQKDEANKKVVDDKGVA